MAAGSDGERWNGAEGDSQGLFSLRRRLREGTSRGERGSQGIVGQGRRWTATSKGTEEPLTIARPICPSAGRRLDLPQRAVELTSDLEERGMVEADDLGVQQGEGGGQGESQAEN